MLRGYRGIIAAAGLATLAVSFLFGSYVGFLAGSPEQQQQSAIAANRSGDNPDNRPDQYLTPRSGIPASIEAAISNPQPATGQDHEKRDLAAQEASAAFSWWMVVVSFLGFCVTFVGTILLYQQIRLTREAVQDTGKATDAMIDANKIARQVALAETRPTLIYETVEFEHFQPECWLGRIRWKNIGKGPATIKTIEIGRACKPQDEDIDLETLLKEFEPAQRDGLGIIVSQGAQHHSTAISFRRINFCHINPMATDLPNPNSLVENDVYLFARAIYTATIGAKDQEFVTEIVMSIKPLILLMQGPNESNEGRYVLMNGALGDRPLAGVEAVAVPNFDCMRIR